MSAHYDYSPFGETVSTQNDTDVLQMSATLNPWRFSSEYADDVTSADYYNYRHYVHNLGRWISYDREEYLSCLNLMGFLNNYPFVTDRLGCGFWDWFASLLGYVAPSPGSEAISSVEPMTKAAIVKAMADIKARIEFLTIQDPTMQNPCVIEEISRLEKRYRELAKMLSKFE